MAALTEIGDTKNEYSDSFLNWYAAHKSILEKKLEEPSMEDMQEFLIAHPEKKLAYWHKVWDSSEDLSFLETD